ncbi:SPL2 [Scenedesmus sp. PABB004]|nr:SPL2 [Scenedesmus sp. PABB004]
MTTSRRLGGPGAQPSQQESAGGPKLCRVAGCCVDVAALGRPYSAKKRICPDHLRALSVCCKGAGDQQWRFCQQCGKLEPLSMFDGKKRSCRASLRRRRAQLEVAAPKPAASQALLPQVVEAGHPASAAACAWAAPCCSDSAASSWGAAPPAAPPVGAGLASAELIEVHMGAELDVAIQQIEREIQLEALIEQELLAAAAAHAPASPAGSAASAATAAPPAGQPRPRAAGLPSAAAACGGAGAARAAHVLASLEALVGEVAAMQERLRQVQSLRRAAAAAADA